MLETIGNGDKKRGGEILLAIASGLREERKANPVFAEGPYHALGKIGGLYEDFSNAVTMKSYGQRGIALALILALVRYLNDEHHPEICEE